MTSSRIWQQVDGRYHRVLTVRQGWTTSCSKCTPLPCLALKRFLRWRSAARFTSRVGGATALWATLALAPLAFRGATASHSKCACLGTWRLLQ